MKKTVMYCDVCGKEVDSLEEICLKEPRNNKISNFNFKPVDLCPDCYDEFLEKFIEVADFLGESESLKSWQSFRKEHKKSSKNYV